MRIVDPREEEWSWRGKIQRAHHWAPGEWRLRYVWLLLLSMLPVGCATFRPVVSDLKHRHLARQAWSSGMESRFRHPYLSDFRHGWKQGYADVAGGADGRPPLLPPERYWNARFQNPIGQARTRSWFDGYQAGAQSAEQDGVREWSYVVTSGAHYPSPQELMTPPVWIEEDGAPESIPLGPMQPAAGQGEALPRFPSQPAVAGRIPVLSSRPTHQVATNTSPSWGRPITPKSVSPPPSTQIANTKPADSPATSVASATAPPSEVSPASFLQKQETQNTSPVDRSATDEIPVKFTGNPLLRKSSAQDAVKQLSSPPGNSLPPPEPPAMQPISGDVGAETPSAVAVRAPATKSPQQDRSTSSHPPKSQRQPMNFSSSRRGWNRDRQIESRTRTTSGAEPSPEGKG